MDFSKNRLSIAEAKEIDMVGYLSRLGFEPAKIRGKAYWYHSPLHDEKTPSFVVNRDRNLWNDFGLGKGGSIIDFGMHFHRCSIPEFLQILSGDISHIPTIATRPEKAQGDITESKIKVLRESFISSPSLIRYLDQRMIPLELADRYCKEVRFESNRKTYFGLGFSNDSGGYEIRNPYFKGSSSPKDVTTIGSGSQNLSVFEGFIDFLSYLTLHGKTPLPKADYLVLNSLSFFEKSLPVFKSYSKVHLNLDNNTAGEKCTRQALALGRHVKDERHRYKGSEDLNDFLLAGKGLRSFTRRHGLRPG